MPQSLPPISHEPPLDTPYRAMVRNLPEIAVSWLDLGLALGLLLMLRLA